MTLTDLFFIIVYGIAIFFVLRFLFRSFHRGKKVVVVEERPVVTAWWPWEISTYNWWPYWSGWYVGGGNGGYVKPPVRPSHGGHGGHSGGHGGHIGGHGGQMRPWGGHGRTANEGGFHHKDARHG